MIIRRANLDLTTLATLPRLTPTFAITESGIVVRPVVANVSATDLVAVIDDLDEHDVTFEEIGGQQPETSTITLLPHDLTDGNTTELQTPKVKGRTSHESVEASPGERWKMAWGASVQNRSPGRHMHLCEFEGTVRNLVDCNWRLGACRKRTIKAVGGSGTFSRLGKFSGSDLAVGVQTFEKLELSVLLQNRAYIWYRLAELPKPLDRQTALLLYPDPAHLSYDFPMVQ
ncbi:hypothetical protein PM082_003848 [Marasmius tenuissimus]|nr:hypothetical protein PM082_003848 [Marasmius tenuissimus]